MKKSKDKTKKEREKFTRPKIIITNIPKRDDRQRNLIADKFTYGNELSPIRNVKMKYLEK